MKTTSNSKNTQTSAAAQSPDKTSNHSATEDYQQCYFMIQYLRIMKPEQASIADHLQLLLDQRRPPEADRLLQHIAEYKISTSPARLLSAKVREQTSDQSRKRSRNASANHRDLSPIASRLRCRGPLNNIV
jgi:hypothetical protein